MWSRLIKLMLISLTLVIGSGCMLSRLTDRGFLGFGDPPKYKKRIYTGLLLLPVAAAIDLATSPIQFLLLVIIGDDFPFGADKSTQAERVAQQVDHEKSLAELTPAQRASLKSYLVQQAKRGKKLPASVGLSPDGSWIDVPVDGATRRRLMARAAHGDNTAFRQDRPAQ